jgi:uncharacterized membrane protein YdbT with pleckstrin-like domain
LELALAGLLRFWIFASIVVIVMLVLGLSLIVWAVSIASTLPHHF